MKKILNKRNQRRLRHNRIRARVSGTATCPRIAVFRSLRGMLLQAIDDVHQKTLAQANSSELGNKHKNTVAEAGKIGVILGEKLVALGITTAAYDRAGYLYHGRVKAAAEGLRQAHITL